MAIVAECPTCGKRFKAAESQAGRKAKCSGCATVFVIAGGDAGGASEMGASAPVATGASAEMKAPVTAVSAPVAAPAPIRPVGSLPPKQSAAGARTAPSVAVAASIAAPAPVVTTRVQVAPARGNLPAAPGRVGDLMPLTRSAGGQRLQGAAQDDALDALILPDSDIADRSASAPKKAAPVAKAKAKAAKPGAVDAAEEDATAPAPKTGRGLRTLMLTLGLLAIAGGAAFFVIPMLRKQMNPPAAIATTKPAITPIDDKVIASGVGPVKPNSPQVWMITPDRASKGLRLPEEFRLVVPAQPPLRYSARSVQMAAAPSPYISVASSPSDDGAAAETISIWNLETRSRDAQFRLAQHLGFPAISRNGAYYAGQVWEESSKSNRVEIWSTARGQLAHAITIPSALAFQTDAVIGFPAEDQVAVLAQDRLQVWDIKARSMVREVEVQARMEDTRAAASSAFKFVAIADSRALYLVDMANGKVIGPALIPDSLTTHPRRRLALRAVEFSPDGTELALLFDNRVSARRVAVFEVATGRLKEIHSLGAPMYQGGPDLQWLVGNVDGAETMAAGGLPKQMGNGFLVGGGVLIDRQTSSQSGQIYGDLPDEGLGGWLATMLDGDRALLAWDKHPKSLVLRSVPVRRESPGWMKIQIASAPAAMYDQLHCAGRAFGNGYPRSSLLQTGKLAGGMRFLAVDVNFTAALAADAPATLPLRPDQFALIADGEPRGAIGTLSADGVFSADRPEFEVRRAKPTGPVATTQASGLSASPPMTFRRQIVFPIYGQEKSLALRVGTTVRGVEMPSGVSPMPQPSLAPPVAELLPVSLVSAPDDSSMFAVRRISARLGPFDADPSGAAAEQIQVPLRVTYSSPDAWLLTVSFDMTVNTARLVKRSSHNRAPKLGLLLPDGTQLMPVVQFPGPLPVTFALGEQRTQTCLFVLINDPGRTRTFRLTCDDIPIATVKPDASTARVGP